MPRSLALAVLLSFVLLAAGCGFHMQGATALPQGVSRVYVTAPDRLSPFMVELGQALERAGAQRAPSAREADAVIRVQADRTGRRVRSVAARNTPKEYEIYYVVDYSIERAGSEVLPVQRIELTRNFTFDQSLLLAKNREEEILRDAMARDLADQALRRLGSLPPAQSGPSR
jgi:LPS-assembly lipoprotein